jgi:glycosyltransferase involved in cell wall biosynthesis
VFFYGGILGHAQGLQIILNAAKKVESHSQIKIIIQGAGPEREELLKLKEQLNVENVIFLPPVDKKQMPGILKEIDVALVPLRKLDIFQGAIPSKIFEALAMKVPLLLGVDGEARRHFIDKARAGVYFEPENIDELAAGLIEMAENPSMIIEMGTNARSYVKENFNRSKIALDFVDQL